MAKPLQNGSRLCLRAHTSSRLIAIAIGLLLPSFYLLPIKLPQGSFSRVLVDRHDQLLGAEVTRDDEQWRFPPAQHVPRKYKTALLTFEDQRFYEHPGVDLWSILRAVWINLKAQKVVSGASTITMQVIRMARKNPPRSFTEKIWEILLALRLERALSKEEIIRVYASHAPFGGNTVGLEAAAWRYVRRPSSELSWAEAATLAVLPNSPSLIHLGRSQHLLKNKRDRLLHKLHKAEHLSDIDLRMALLEPLLQPPRPLPLSSTHVLHSFVPPQSIFRSTLDRRLQEEVIQRISHHQTTLADLGVDNASALVIHVPTAEIRAYIGNIGRLSEQKNGSHIDMISAPRSTGSLLKPFLYGSMLESGELLPSQIVPDIPVRIGGFRPENFNRDYHGAIAADLALAQSLNVPAVVLLKRYGLGRFMSEMRTAGLKHIPKPPSHYGLPFILGGRRIITKKMAALYTQLAFIARDSGQTWPGLSLGPKSWPAYPLRLRPGSAYLTINALYADKHSNSRGAISDLSGIAWKTGTSFGFRDAWAVGMTPEYVVAVWTGNADGEGRPQLTGTRAAVPLLLSIFGLLTPSRRFPPPRDHLKVIDICPYSGLRAGPRCQHRHSQLVPKNTVGHLCSYCQVIPSTQDRQFRLHSRCARLDEIYQNKFFVLSAQQEHFFTRKHPDYSGLPPYRTGCQPSHDKSEDFDILFPQDNSQLYMPIDLDGQRSHVVCKATHRNPKARLFWFLDENYLGETENFHEYEILPMPGSHTLTVVDTFGETKRRSFTIISP